MRSIGLTMDPSVQKYLREANELELISIDAIPLFKSGEEYFLGGWKSFYTLVPDTTREEIDRYIDGIKEKNTNTKCLISTRFAHPNVSLLNYVLETKDIIDAEKRFDLYEKKTRNLVRKSYKNNFVLKIGKTERDFYKLYETSIKRLGGVVKSQEWFLMLEKSLPENVLICSLFDGDKIIASNFCLLSKDYIFLMFNVSDPAYWEYAVNDRLYDELIRWGIENNIGYIDFGPGTLSDSSHNHFKAGFGAKSWYLLNRRFGTPEYRFKAFLGVKRHNMKLRFIALIRNKIQIFKYLISGGIATSVDIGLLYIFTAFFGFWYLVSATVAFILALCVSFCLQKFWTFDKKNLYKIHREATLYISVSIFNVFLNSLLVYIFTDILNLWYIISQIISAGLIAFLSFFTYKYFVFKNE